MIFSYFLIKIKINLRQKESNQKHQLSTENKNTIHLNKLFLFLIFLINGTGMYGRGNVKSNTYKIDNLENKNLKFCINILQRGI